MPHQQCSVCLSPRRDLIDQALLTGSPSMRELARQVGLSHASIFRHKQHGRPVKGKETRNIKAEIAKLRAAQTAAKRRRDIDSVLSISREIRAWMALEAKTQTISDDGGQKAEGLSRSEALSLAMTIIESELPSQEVIGWLEQLHERVGHIVVPATPVSKVQDE